MAEEVTVHSVSGTSEHLAEAMATVALGAAVQGILGFGCSLVWMSLFPLFTTIPDAIGVLQPLAIGLNALLLSQLWRHSNLRDLQPLAMTAPIGILFGLWVVTAWPAHAVNGLLGVFLLCYVANTVREDHNKQSQPLEAEENESSELEELVTMDQGRKAVKDEEHPPTPIPTSSTKPSPVALPAGFIGGCLASAFGTAGPAILVYAREAGWEAQPEKFRANLQVVFFSLNILAITSQSLSGIINKDTLRVTVVLIPALVAGGFGGSKLASKVRKDVFRVLVLGGITIMGLLFVSKAFPKK